LILAPIVVLAVVGFVSFRQDHAATERVATERVATERVATERVATERVATERVATERAQEIVAALMFRLEKDGDLSPLANYAMALLSPLYSIETWTVPAKPETDLLLVAFESKHLLAAILDEKSQLVYPPPYCASPETSSLCGPDEAALWKHAELAEFVQADPSAALEDYLSIESPPPRTPGTASLPVAFPAKGPAGRDSVPAVPIFYTAGFNRKPTPKDAGDGVPTRRIPGERTRW